MNKLARLIENSWGFSEEGKTEILPSTPMVVGSPRIIKVSTPWGEPVSEKDILERATQSSDFVNYSQGATGYIFGQVHYSQIESDDKTMQRNVHYVPVQFVTYHNVRPGRRARRKE